MSTTDESNTDEVVGNIVDVIHVDNSGTEPVRTVLALATKDDLSVSIDESTESFDRGNLRRTLRNRTNNEVDVEVTSAVSTDLDALETVGVVDTNGKVDFSSASRDLGSDEFIELGYAEDELDYSNDPGPDDYDQMHRFSDVEVMLDGLDPSATPITVSLVVMVEGDIELDASTL